MTSGSQLLTIRDPATFSPMERWLASIPPEARQQAIKDFIRASPPSERASLQYAWNALWARPAQRLPSGRDWRLWFIRAGRGFGKTRCGSEGVRKLVEAGKAQAVTIIAPTAPDARDVMIEGPESGLLAVHPSDTRPTYEPSKRLLTWPNGAIGRVRSAEDPDSLRGLNSDLVWGDEPSSWKSGIEAWDMAMLGNRLGTPHAILTGTPRPYKWLMDLEAATGTVLSTGNTYENIANLAPAFIQLIIDRYEGSRLGAQELHANYLEDVEGALWQMLVIEATRLAKWDVHDPWLSLGQGVTNETRSALNLGPISINVKERRRWSTWVGVDPPGETAECGIVVGSAPERGRSGRDHAVILDDQSQAGPPEVWGAKVVQTIKAWNADGAVVEANQGGDMVRAVIHAVDSSVRVEKIRARESKADRAEPVAAAYGKGWVHHVGYLPTLETQMCTWVPGESRSPDRVDALVHLVTKLLRPSSLASQANSTVHSPLGRSIRRAS